MVKKYSYKLLLIILVVFIPLFSLTYAAQTNPGGQTIIGDPGGQTVTGDPGGCNPNTSGKICNPINVDTINDFIRIILVGVLKIGIPIVALAIIYCGFLFVAARGNAEKLTKAKDALLYTIIGAAVLLGAWALSILISETVLSLSIININIDLL